MSCDRARDEDLMERVASGQPEAMTFLVRRYGGPLLTFMRRMTGDRHRAEEMFQEAFLAVWQNRHRYVYPRPFRAWLFGIAANKCRAALRNWRPMAALLVDDPDPPATADDSAPVEAAIATERAALVARAVALLPPKQRMVLVLRVWNGLEYGEIARILALSEGGIRSQMFHALAALRRYLEPRLRRSDEC
jgi:RNA polymerase sigma-70 factor, ECF subfamily